MVPPTKLLLPAPTVPTSRIPPDPTLPKDGLNEGVELETSLPLPLSAESLPETRVATGEASGSVKGEPNEGDTEPDLDAGRRRIWEPGEVGSKDIGGLAMVDLVEGVQPYSVP